MKKTIDEIKQELEKAEKLIGKKVEIGPNSIFYKTAHPFLVRKVDFSLKPNGLSLCTQEALEHDGYVIVLYGEEKKNIAYGYHKALNSLELNDQYTAEIHGNNVKVGCQTFPKEKILELAEMIKNNE